jgi:membrane fusion protein, multidrug efflux system
MAFLLFTRQRTHVEAATEQLTAEGQKGPSVEIATARKVAGSNTVRLIGEARPYQSAILYAKVSGYMRSISVDKGDFVHANQIHGGDRIARDRQAISSRSRRCAQ